LMALKMRERLRPVTAAACAGVYEIGGKAGLLSLFVIWCILFPQRPLASQGTCTEFA
jgi:hypothetical protein